MANKRADTLEMRMRLETGEVNPMHLRVTLSDFTDWALLYILIKDEDTNWAVWHEVERVARVCHTDEFQDFQKRLVQFMITQPLQKAQTYPSPPRSAAYCTVSLPVWQDAYRLLDTVGFLEDDLCTPLGVYVTFLVHGVRECEGGGGPMCVPHMLSTIHIPCTVVGGIVGSCEAVCPWASRSEGEGCINWHSNLKEQTLT